MFIQLQNLTRRYYNNEIVTTALDNVHLEIEKGEFLAIMGPSGCGKSTLLNILGLIEHAEEGSYSLEGREMVHIPVKEMTKLRRGKIGMVFQNYNLVEELTVFENVELPLFFNSVNRNTRRRMVINLLERLKIAHRKDHYPHQLSGGQQQRVALARAIVIAGEDPGSCLLLADEPTGNLDSKNGNTVMQLISEFNKEGTTVIMVSHSARDAAYAHRIVNLHDGRIM